MGKADARKVIARRLLIAVLSCSAMVAIASPAHAYVSEVPATELAAIPQLRDYFADPLNPTPAEIAATPCAACHGTDAATEPSGPHGNYTASTNKCATCHAVHNAPAGGILLLPAATVLATCETCHDGTGGTGVYGVILARTGIVPAADHNMLDQTSIPGGDDATGGDRTYTFSGTNDGLTCSDCHSPHGSSTVADFTGDRGRSADDLDPDNAVVSDRLLKQQPNGGLAAVTVYGSDWCGSCHAGRLSKTGLHNHPVDWKDSSLTTDPFTYQSVVYWTGGTGTLGHTNDGYVMPDVPRLAAQTGHNPICQQCHEDPRRVGDVTLRTIDAGEVFTITAVDGSPDDNPSTPDVPGSNDNPRFQVFPHESENVRFLLETDDDLCLNCHKQPRTW